MSTKRNPHKPVAIRNKPVAVKVKPAEGDPKDLVMTTRPEPALATIPPELLERLRNLSKTIEAHRAELADLAEAFADVTERMSVRGRALREFRAALDVCRREACTATGLTVEANYRINLGTGEIFPS